MSEIMNENLPLKCQTQPWGKVTVAAVYSPSGWLGSGLQWIIRSTSETPQSTHRPPVSHQTVLMQWQWQRESIYLSIHPSIHLHWI